MENLIQYQKENSVGVNMKGKDKIDKGAETAYIERLRTRADCIHGFRIKPCKRKKIKPFAGRGLRLEKSCN